MFRPRVAPPLPPLDDLTTERLLRGTPIEELPEAHQPLGELFAAVRQPATDRELEGSAAAAAAFVAAHVVVHRRARQRRPLSVLAITGVLLAASTGTAYAATEGALPQPVQAVAHDALGVVGIAVPGVTPGHPDPTVDDESPAGSDLGAPGSTSATDAATNTAGATSNPHDGPRSTSVIGSTDDHAGAPGDASDTGNATTDDQSATPPVDTDDSVGIPVEDPTDARDPDPSARHDPKSPPEHEAPPEPAPRPEPKSGHEPTKGR